MAWFIAATLAAFFIKGLCGFANTLIFQSILSFSVNNADISPVELVLGFPGNAILTWQNRKSLNPRIFLPLTALMLAGNIPGALMLKSMDGRIIKVIFGVVIICIALNMLLEQSKEPHAPKKWMTALVGIAAGILSGLFGVGALLAAYVSRITDTGSGFKANISVGFPDGKCVPPSFIRHTGHDYPRRAEKRAASHAGDARIFVCRHCRQPAKSTTMPSKSWCCFSSYSPARF